MAVKKLMSFERVVGVSSCVGDYSKHILMYDFDGINRVDRKSLTDVSNAFNVDLHIFKSSADGYHVLSFDVFHDVYELDTIQKMLRLVGSGEEKKRYSTILEVIAEGVVHGDAHALALDKNIPQGWIEARTKWRANVLRVGKKGEKSSPKFLFSILNINDVRPISMKHIQLYKLLGFVMPQHHYQNREINMDKICVSIYRTSNRLKA